VKPQMGLESSVKKCHGMSRVMKMTPDTRHLSRFHEKEATIGSGAPQLWRVNLISISIERDGRGIASLDGDEPMNNSEPPRARFRTENAVNGRVRHDLLINASQ